jgi:hypothetical protein
MPKNRMFGHKQWPVRSEETCKWESNTCYPRRTVARQQPGRQGKRATAVIVKSKPFVKLLVKQIMNEESFAKQKQKSIKSRTLDIQARFTAIWDMLHDGKTCDKPVLTKMPG